MSVGIKKDNTSYSDKLEKHRSAHTFLLVPLRTIKVSPRVSIVSSDTERLPSIAEVDALL